MVKIYQVRKLTLFIICLGITAGMYILLSNESYSAPTQATVQQQEKRKNRDVGSDEIPLVKFETQELGKQRQMRSTANDKPIEEMPNVTDITESESWIERLPALPIEKSDAVIVGTVTQAEAHLSAERTIVYSEYTISVDEVLNGKTDLSLHFGRTLTATREGGRVQFPSGHIQTYRMSGQGFLRGNRKYVLFVKQNKETQDFLLLTGYQLRKGKVIPVDQVTNHAVYKGADETDFINTVRRAIANSVKGAN